MEERKPRIDDRITLIEIVKHLRSMLSIGEETIKTLDAINDKETWSDKDWALIRHWRKEIKEERNQQ